MNTVWQIVVKATLFLVAYFAPVQEVFYAMLVFVGIDLITGVWASSTKKVPRSSRRARKSVKKLGGYLLVVFLSFMIEEILSVDWIIAHRIVAAVICTIELLSILENIAVITENPVFLRLIKLVRGKVATNDVIKDIINEKNDVFSSPERDNSDRVQPSKKVDGNDGQC